MQVTYKFNCHLDIWANMKSLIHLSKGPFSNFLYKFILPCHNNLRDIYLIIFIMK